MRLAEIAKELRITTQELRHELEKTNFGISPTAHEVADALGSGIIRFLKGKVKPTLTHRRVATVFSEESDDQEAEDKPKKRTHIIRKKSDERGNELIIDEPEPSKKPESASSETDNETADESTDETSDDSTNSSESDSDHEDEADPASLEPKKPRVPTVNDRIAQSISRGEIKIRRPRSAVPRPGDTVQKGGSGVNVSRRIEVDKKSEGDSNETDKDSFPKNYYKKKGKKGRRKVGGEEDILNMMRHGHKGKAKVSRVNYQTEDQTELSLEELAIERQLDQERFRAQKKNRASGQNVGPKDQPQIKAKEGVIEIPDVVSVKEFSEKCGLPVTSVIANLMKNGIMATINQKIDFDTASIIAADLNVEVKMAEKDVTSEDLFAGDMKKLLLEEDKSQLKTRPPIVTIMGHVDHGKTKLLDTIRDANVVAGESGGITQHIGAYQVRKNDHLITFLDTPGHEAFTSMRARGAKVTDIAILVVAADEGVKPQTVEAINHGKEAGVPIIVAINKIDKPNANIDKVKGELVEHGLQSEDWGGKVIMVPVSAHTGEGIDQLLEMILLVAEVENLQANPDRMAVGTVVESHLDPSLGPVATIIVNTGTLNLGDSIVVGHTMGRIKAMHDYKADHLKNVPPSGAVRISGLNKVPKAGDLLQAFKNEKIAKERLNQVIELDRQHEESQSGSMVERIVSQINKGGVKYLKLVVKADTKGSLEAILQALNKIKSHDVAIKVIHFGVGNISDTDVIMASASQAILIGFHVVSNSHVEKLAQREHVDIKNYTIIYKLTEDMTAILSGMLEPEINVIELGKLEVKQVFLNKKTWIILGCKVTQGKVEKEAMVRVMRKGELLFETRLDSLKHVSEDVSELEKGADCGIRIKTPKPVEEGDILEAFKIERKERTLL